MREQRAAQAADSGGRRLGVPWRAFGAGLAEVKGLGSSRCLGGTGQNGRVRFVAAGADSHLKSGVLPLNLK